MILWCAETKIILVLYGDMCQNIWPPYERTYGPDHKGLQWRHGETWLPRTNNGFKTPRQSKIINCLYYLLYFLKEFVMITQRVTSVLSNKPYGYIKMQSMHTLWETWSHQANYIGWVFNSKHHTYQTSFINIYNAECNLSIVFQPKSTCAYQEHDVTHEVFNMFTMCCINSKKQ